MATGAALLALVAACDEFATLDRPGGIVIYDGGAGGQPDGGIRPHDPVLTGEIAPVYGFVSPAAKVEYYYLGEVEQQDGKIPVNAIYWFYDEDNKPLFRLSEDGTRVVGWKPVVDVVPTKDGYSPFWRVHRVRVKGKADHAAIDSLKVLPKITAPEGKRCQMDAVCPEGEKCVEERCRAPIKVGIFDLDALKSKQSIDSSRLLVRETSTLLNCPVVDADATLLKGLSNPDLPFPKVQLWYKRLKAFCYLMEGGRAILGRGLGALPGNQLPDPIDAYFIRQKLDFGTGSTKSIVLAKRHLVLTEHLPGSSSYSPIVRESSLFVDDEHEFKDVRSVAEAKQKGLEIARSNRLHLLVVRGTIPACKSDDDCAGTGGKVDPPLKCSVEQGYCSPPFARLGEECRRGVKECDPKGGPGGTALACVGLRVRDKYFCFNACDGNAKDTNPDKEIDTRCGSVKGFQCFPLRQTDPTRPNGVCIQRCNSRAGDTQALLDQCVSTSCGDGKLDYGEACDDGNTRGPTTSGGKVQPVQGDGCNQFCSLSTLTRCDKDSDCKGTDDEPSKPQTCKAPVAASKDLYCAPPNTLRKDETVENNKYRTICMEFDYCWPPDERADWLGKKEDAQ